MTKYDEHAISLIGDFENDLGEVAKLLRSNDVEEAKNWLFYLRKTWGQKKFGLIAGPDYTGQSYEK